MIRLVEVSGAARRQLRKVPRHILAKLLAWIDAVERIGLEEVRKQPGYRDHPLKGNFDGKRAIYLSKKWRAVYEIKARADGSTTIEFVELQEVHPHGY